MKIRKSGYLTFVVWLFALLASAADGQAQISGSVIVGGRTTFGGGGGGGHQVYKPGSMIRISVTFQGPDAKKISSVKAELQLSGNPRNNQNGFQVEMFPGTSTATGPNTFAVSFVIPNNQASGEYQVKQLRAAVLVDGSPVELTYTAPAEFPVVTYRVENPNEIVKPTITELK